MSKITRQWPFVQDPTLPEGFSVTFRQRFWAKVDKRGPDDCWLWTGAVYGPMHHGHLRRGAALQGDISAHRAVWLLEKGAIPDDLQVCHDCPGGDNPKCVNPAHLWLGTLADNIKDAAKKGRMARGETHHWHKCTEVTIKEIRALWKRGELKQFEIAARFGLSRQAISLIVRRKIWRHVV